MLRGSAEILQEPSGSSPELLGQEGDEDYSAAISTRPAVNEVFSAKAALASSYSADRRATKSAAAGISFTDPMPWPQPQMSRQALAFWLPPEPKFIAEASETGKFAGSRPAATIDGVR